MNAFVITVHRNVFLIVKQYLLYISEELVQAGYENRWLVYPFYWQGLHEPVSNGKWLAMISATKEFPPGTMVPMKSLLDGLALESLPERGEASNV